MSQLGLILQESLRNEREARTILGLLTEQMDAVDRGPRRRRTLKERLRFTGIGCCGATWVFRPATLTVRDEGGTQQNQHQQTIAAQDPNPVEPECVGPTPSSSGMNLAAALAAERQFREAEAGGEGEARRVAETPWRVSLMRLLEETEGGDAEVEAEKGTAGNDSVCCVCMGRKKGAAFIPCGHTFCRVCSRELWLNRGTCPLCNRSILEILDIF
ncbi:baculoviral IAP repeat-containing protein 7-like [Abrus precatorius]|uniref:Baculoviral IAP repeat-containing protein 7-like n=1 Tax=Abrus precatorius TaxID=3816 RepID=A0A8B8JPG8_ABRPR|nr:baculoviral IAP repeat-containing protein 7-like [Abrus precatorius]